LESEAAAEEAIEEAAITSKVEAEKAALLRRGVSKPDALLNEADARRVDVPGGAF
jgi:hypothetical protein